MGLSACAVELIINEHLYRTLDKARVLLIGRQNTDLTPGAMTRLLDLYDLLPRESYAIEKPGSMNHTVQSLGPEFERLADVSVFRSLADCTVSALDISDYEGAEIIHDMNRPLPWRYKRRFDFVYDGSSLDNIFNGPQALMNMWDLLKPGGRLVMYDAANSAKTAYAQYSPDWYIDFFAINNAADCKIYVQEFPRGAQPIFADPVPTDEPPISGCLWHFDPLVQWYDQWGYQNSQISDGVERYTYVIAEKSKESTSNVMPVQLHYRGNNHAPYVASAQRFRASKRPVFVPRSAEPFSAPSLSEWEVLYPVGRWHRRSYPDQKSPYVNQAPVTAPVPERRRPTQALPNTPALANLSQR
jgi:SAM-dependent methyltransferase